MERRIAAILAADMVGFSRLVEMDETGTITRQKRHFTELIEPAFERVRSIRLVIGPSVLRPTPFAVRAASEVCVTSQSHCRKFVEPRCGSRLRLLTICHPDLWASLSFRIGQANSTWCSVLFDPINPCVRLLTEREHPLVCGFQGSRTSSDGAKPCLWSDPCGLRS